MATKPTIDHLREIGEIIRDGITYTDYGEIRETRNHITFNLYDGDMTVKIGFRDYEDAHDITLSVRYKDAKNDISFKKHYTYSRGDEIISTAREIAERINKSGVLRVSKFNAGTIIRDVDESEDSGDDSDDDSDADADDADGTDSGDNSDSEWIVSSQHDNDRICNLHVKAVITFIVGVLGYGMWLEYTGQTMGEL